MARPQKDATLGAEETTNEANPTEEPMPTEEKKGTLTPDADGMVKVSKEKLDAILNRMDRLEYATSKAGLATYDSRHKDKQGKFVQLRTFEGLVVTSWSDLVVNNVEKDGNGRWSEDQRIRITTEDGKEAEMPLFLFTRRYAYLKAEVISEVNNLAEEEVAKYGKQTFKVKVDDGKTLKEYTIGSKFVN